MHIEFCLHSMCACRTPNVFETRHMRFQLKVIKSLKNMKSLLGAESIASQRNKYRFILFWSLPFFMSLNPICPSLANVVFRPLENFLNLILELHSWFFLKSLNKLESPLCAH